MKTATMKTGQKIELHEAPMPHHLKGLWYTATGYGSKIPTIYKARYNNKFYRVYSSCFSNVSTQYITVNKVKTIINIDY